ncbi:sigma-70 family RNA polymerase sigma factor [Streptomyces sp. NPDC051214]|uniref:RNA polymerase sigma factor n=1 Tax=Streptomyces sp. NPDC051214 TaxID=3155282 RepID=UPI00341BB08C
MTKVPSMRRIVYALTSAQRTHIDDVMSKVLLALFTRLTSGPLEGSVPAYLKTITVRMARQHLEELRRRAEDFVGDDTYKLEDPSAGVSVNPASHVELQQAMPVLREELSPLQLKAFVLNEAYGLQAPVIAGLLGGSVTKGSVRDALRHARHKLRCERVGLRLGVLAQE